MKHFDYLIIGGGVAGTTCAETIRKYDSHGSVAIVSEEEYPLYSRISLSKESFFLGKTSRGSIFIRSSDWYKALSIELFLGKNAMQMDRDSHCIFFSDGTQFSYGQVLIATGAHPKKHVADMRALSGIHYVRTLRDTEAIIINLQNVKNVVVVGCGFISFELLGLLRKKNITVTSVFTVPRYWEHALDRQASTMVESALINAGVSLKPRTIIRSFNGREHVSSLTLSSGDEIPADMVICGLGIERDTRWLFDTGLAHKEGVAVNEYLQSEDSSVYAAGDVASFYDVLLKETHQLGNWVNAQMHGRTAGYNMTHDGKVPYSYISSYSSTSVGITLSFVGDSRICEGRSVITRGPASQSYGLLISEGSVVTGAVLINRGHEIVPLSKIITNRVAITPFLKQFSDPSADLKKIL